MTKQPFYKSLYVQVLIAIAIGIALGHYPASRATTPCRCCAPPR